MFIVIKSCIIALGFSDIRRGEVKLFDLILKDFSKMVIFEWNVTMFGMNAVGVNNWMRRTTDGLSQ